MDNKNKYQLDERIFKRAYNIANEVYNISIIVRDYCKYHDESECMFNMLSVVNFLKNKADILLCFFTNIDMEVDENEWRDWKESKV